MHGHVHKDGILSHLRLSVLQQLVTVRFATIGQWYLHLAVVTGPYLKTKLKSDEYGHALKAASDTISFFVDMFLHFFFENAN